MKLMTFTRTLVYVGTPEWIKTAHWGPNDTVRGVRDFGRGKILESQRSEPTETEDSASREQLWHEACHHFDQLSAEQRERFEQLYFPSEDV